LANFDFYSAEISKIQDELVQKVGKLVKGLTKLNNTEVMRIAKQIDFFNEMEKLGYTSLMARVSQEYDDEIVNVFKELSKTELTQVPSASVRVLNELKEFDIDYLTGQARQYATQLKQSMLRGIITGQTNEQIIAGITTSFGVGKFISSSEASFLLNDAFATFSNASRAKAFAEFPDIKFTYIGPDDDVTRQACQSVLDLVAEKGPFTQKEINAITIDGFGGFSRRGGYNCRHNWVRV